MFSEKIEINISRRVLRILAVMNYYACHTRGDDNEEILISEFNNFLERFICLFLDISVHTREGFRRLGRMYDIEKVIPHFNECLTKYKIEQDYDDLLMLKIEDKCRGCEENDFFNVFQKAMLQVISDEDIISYFKIGDEMFLFRNLLQQFIKNIKEDIIFDKILNVEEVFKQEREFYSNLVKILFVDFDILCIQYLSNVKSWEISRIFILDKIIIILAITEFRIYNTPRAVVINEYIEIAKMFSTAKSGVFVNGLLDKII